MKFAELRIRGMTASRDVNRGMGGVSPWEWKDRPGE